MEIEANQSLVVKQRYKKLGKIGEGAYGVVYKCQDLLGSTHSSFVALKKIKLDIQDDEGVPSTTIREISILQRLKHPNLV